MRYLYTNNPDEWCHKVADGVYGKPVQASQQAALMAKGWKLKPEQIEVSNEKSKSQESTEEATQEKVLSRDEQAELLSIPLIDDEGNKRHWKVVQADIDKALSDEHNEG